MAIPPLLRVQSLQVLLLWVSNISMLCYYIHRFTYPLHPLLRFVLGVLAGILLVFLCHLSYWRRTKIHKRREEYARQMTNLGREDLLRFLPEAIANSAASKNPDELEWLNKELLRAWPYLDKAAAHVVRDALQPILDQYKMGLLQEIKIPSLSFGVASPRFLGVATEEMGEDEASVELKVDWRASRETILVKLKTVGPDFKVKIRNVHVSGTLKLVLKPLKEEMPCFGAILVALSGVPVIDFDVKIMDGDIGALPGLEKMIDNSVRTAIEDSLVWPNRFVFPVIPGDYSFLELKPVGILDVSLLEATNVMNTDLLGKSDCFALIYVRKKPDRVKRSTTKKNTLHPVWNEGFRIEVDDPMYQELTVQLMDEESFSQSEYIGRAVVPLKDLHPHDPQDVWLDMVESPNLLTVTKKPRARVHVIYVYEPFNQNPSAAGSKEPPISREDNGGGKEPETSAEDHAAGSKEPPISREDNGGCKEPETSAEDHGVDAQGFDGPNVGGEDGLEAEHKGREDSLTKHE